MSKQTLREIINQPAFNTERFIELVKFLSEQDISIKDKNELRSHWHKLTGQHLEWDDLVNQCIDGGMIDEPLIELSNDQHAIQVHVDRRGFTLVQAMDEMMFVKRSLPACPWYFQDCTESTAKHGWMAMMERQFNERERFLLDHWNKYMFAGVVEYMPLHRISYILKNLVETPIEDV